VVRSEPRSLSSPAHTERCRGRKWQPDAVTVVSDRLVFKAAIDARGMIVRSSDRFYPDDDPNLDRVAGVLVYGSSDESRRFVSLGPKGRVAPIRAKSVRLSVDLRKAQHGA
jgi:hypothetical protein